MISEEGAQRQIAQGFELRREQEPEPPDEMIREWMKQTDPYTKRQRAHFDRPLHRRKQ